MKLNSNMQQMNFATMGRVSQSVQQSIRSQKIDAGTTEWLPNGSLPPKGHVNPFEDPYLNKTGKSPSEWQKIIPVDDDVAQKLKDLAKEDMAERFGMCGTGAQADKQANIIKSYIATLPGEKRLAAIYSCEQIAYQEADRLIGKVREQNPNWKHGQKFDTSILDEAATKSFDMKA